MSFPDMQYQYQQQPPPAPAGAPMAMPQQQQQQQQQQHAPPQEAANPFDQFDQPVPAPQPAPMQQPPMQMQMQQQPLSSSSSLVPQQNANANQWGLPQQQQQQPPPPAVPPQPQAPQQPFGMPAPVPAPAQQQQAPQTNFDPFAGTPAAPMPSAAPPAAMPVQTYQQQAPLDLVVASPPPAAAPPAAPPAARSDDPFGVFAAAPAQPQPQPPVPADADPFGLGTSYQHSSSNGLNESFASSSISNSAHGSSAGGGLGLFTAGTDPTIGAASSSWLDVSDLNRAAAGNAEGAAYVASSSSSNPGVLPPGGEHYQVDIPDRLLGLVMYKPTAAASCGVLAQHNAVTIESLGPSRPVVTHLNTNSAAKAAGVALGDVVTAINGQEVADRVDASNLIRSTPRPVTLQMYRLPGAPTTLYQGDVWVHYKNRDALPPPKVKDWKPKFVVVGGILGGGSGSKVINMYRSRAEYDRAVADVHSSRKVSVKVKQFSLEGGARLWFKDGTTDGGMSGSDGMETIKYPAEDASRHYVNILMPKPANNIKLSVPAGQTNQLRSVLDGIRLALYMYSN